MKETPEKLQWHPAFYAATELELRENYDDLEFESKHNLSKAPLQMDLLIIKKRRDVELKNEIGRMMRKHNITRGQATCSQLIPCTKSSDMLVYIKHMDYR